MKTQQHKPQVFKLGFTLIELLIVVAIIAILAAIAVPNFLEAQVRSKVSRVKSDLRTLATAEEAYAIDHNGYTEDQDNDFSKYNRSHGDQGLRGLSTPVAYVTTAYFVDPFGAQELVTNTTAVSYQMGSGMDPNRRSHTVGLTPIKSYVLFSFGPNKLGEQTEDDWPWGSALDTTHRYAVRPYDPTNGTISSGDINRVGGDINNNGGDPPNDYANWTVWGAPHNKFPINQ